MYIDECYHRYKEGCECGMVRACKDCGEGIEPGHHQHGCGNRRESNQLSVRVGGEKLIITVYIDHAVTVFNQSTGITLDWPADAPMAESIRTAVSTLTEIST